MVLTNIEVERVLSCPKRITQACKWQRRKDRQGHELDLAVGFLNDETGQWDLGSLKAIAVPGVKSSVVLLYSREPIRRLDYGRHRNPDGELFTGIHKHRWDEADGQRWAYQPTEFANDDLVKNPNSVFLQFIEECGIELMGEYQPFLLE